MAALVVLAGRLPGHAQPGSYFWPADAHADRVVDQYGEFGLGFLLYGPGALDPL